MIMRYRSCYMSPGEVSVLIAKILILFSYSWFHHRSTVQVAMKKINRNKFKRLNFDFNFHKQKEKYNLLFETQSGTPPLNLCW